MHVSDWSSDVCSSDLLSQSVQSCLSTENDRIRAAMAIVDGANSIDVVSGKYMEAILLVLGNR